MYSARISRNSPAAFIILIDQSGSMAETVVIDRKEVVKAKAVAFIVNMLIAELLNRSRREEGYRDYFDIAVLGYHGDEVASLWKNPNRMFMRPNDLIGNELSRVPVQRERRLPDGSTVVSSVCQKIWVEPYAGGKTPMYHALTECYRLCKAWCGAKAHRKSYPPTIFNITDGESSDGDDFKLQEIADSIKGLSTEDGAALLINIHISSDIIGKTKIPSDFPDISKDNLEK